MSTERHITARALDMIKRRSLTSTLTPSIKACTGEFWEALGVDGIGADDIDRWLNRGTPLPVPLWPTCAHCLVLIDDALERPTVARPLGPAGTG